MDTESSARSLMMVTSIRVRGAAAWGKVGGGALALDPIGAVGTEVPGTAL
jgi:hypothetical protein